MTCDNNGRLSTKTQGGLTTTYDYDVFGNLRSVALPGNGTVSYTIDPANRRIARTKGVLTTERLVFVGLHPVAQLTDDGSDWKRHFVYSSRGHVPDIMYEKNGSTVDVYRLVTDHLGSLRMVVKLDGASTPTVVQRMSYDEWGNVLEDGPNNPPPGYTKVPFGYAGGLYDRETGLVRFGARDYDAESGRWTAKDPLGFGGGDSDVYAYVAGDPVNFIDPSGLEPAGFAFPDRSIDFAAARAWAQQVYQDATAIRVEGHHLFPGEIHSSERHQWASKELTLRHGGSITRLLGFINELQGLLLHDIPDLRRRINGTRPWAFQLQDLEDNEIGIAAARGDVQKPCPGARAPVSQ